MSSILRTERRGAARAEAPALLRFSGACDTDPLIDPWFDARPPELMTLAYPWFERMRHCGPDVRELFHDGCPVVCVDDAPFAQVNVFGAHVNVGFFHGAALEPPFGLVRHDDVEAAEPCVPARGAAGAVQPAAAPRPFR